MATKQSDLVGSVLDYAQQNPAVAGAVVITVTAALFALSTMLKPKKLAAKALNAETAKVFTPFPLKEKIVVSHDTRIYRFALQHEGQVFGLPIGHHVALKAEINGAACQRAYTPISSDDDKGTFDLLVKVYFKNTHPKFPDGGKLSQHLESMKIGDTILVKGPTGRFTYLENGNVVVKGKERKVESFAMIAGGTGITPLLQVMRAILKNPADKTKMSLLFANRNEEDILLREELAECAKDPRCTVQHTLSAAPAGWQQCSGHVNEAMVKQYLPAGDGGKTMALMCGPAGLCNQACKPNLALAGYAPEDVYCF